MEATKIESLREFDAIIRKLKREHGDRALVFRGQRADYPIRPSASRHLRDPEDQLRLPLLRYIWEMFADFLALDLAHLSDNHKDSFIAGMAVLQHYGFRSWFVDVSHNHKIALWFACHQFVLEKGVVKSTDCKLPDGHDSPYPLDHALAVVDMPKYDLVTTGKGFVYVIGIPERDKHLLLDLRAILKRSALRVFRQEASGLLSPEDGRSIEDLVVAKIEVPVVVAQELRLDTLALFPPPSKDRAYKALLGVPYLVPEFEIQTHASMAHPVLPVPLYKYDSGLPEWESLQMFKIVLGQYAPEEIVDKDPGRVAIQLPTTPPGGPKEVFHPSKMETPQDDEAAGDLHPVEASDSRLWPSSRLALLTPFAHMLPVYLRRRSAYPIFRGFLVDLDEDVVVVQPIVEDLKHILAGDRMVIPYAGGVDGLSADAFDAYSKILELTNFLRTGEAGLWKVHDKLFHYYWILPDGNPWYRPNGVRWVPGAKGGADGA